MANSAVWNDDAVNGALDSASFWVKSLPYVKSLSGHWKFFLASRPSKVPEKFYDSAFHDSEWKTLPGIDGYVHFHFLLLLLLLPVFPLIIDTYAGTQTCGSEETHT